LVGVEKAAVAAFVDSYAAAGLYPLSNNRGISGCYIPCLTDPLNAVHPLFPEKYLDTDILLLGQAGTGALPTHDPGRGMAMVGVDASNAGFAKTTKTMQAMTADHSGNGIGYGVCYTDVSGVPASNGQAYFGARRASTDWMRLNFDGSSLRHQANGFTSGLQTLVGAPGTFVDNDPVMLEFSGGNYRFYSAALDKIATGTVGTGVAANMTQQLYFGANNNNGNMDSGLIGDHTLSLFWCGRFDSDSRRTDAMTFANQLMLDLGVYV